MNKEEGNVQDQDFGVTHCLEASEDALDHCLYIAMQAFLRGKDDSKTAWLVSAFSTPGPPCQGESEVFLCCQGMEIGLCQKVMTVREKEKTDSSLQPGYRYTIGKNSCTSLQLFFN